MLQIQVTVASFLSVSLNRHQAGWFPFRQEGGQQQAPNNADPNNEGPNANNLELEEMVGYGGLSGFLKADSP